MVRGDGRVDGGIRVCGVGIPAFLCAWLRHAYAGYVPQYVRFGVGRMLECPDDLLRIQIS